MSDTYPYPLFVMLMLQDDSIRGLDRRELVDAVLTLRKALTAAEQRARCWQHAAQRVERALVTAEQRAERAVAAIKRVRAVAEYARRAANDNARGEEATAWLNDVADEILAVLTDDTPDAGGADA